MLKDIVHVPRTDPVYNMHGYLTKVPIKAIIPFIEEFSAAGDTVVDMFAGSGMTAIAAKIAGRNAVVSDISKLGQHIGKGYLVEVPEKEFTNIANNIVDESRNSIGELYNTINSETKEIEKQIRTIWSFVYECNECKAPLTYFKLLEKNSWKTNGLLCSNCGSEFDKKKAKYIGDHPVKVVVKNSKGKQIEQEVTEFDFDKIAEAQELNVKDSMPNHEITPDREMFRRSALRKWKTTNTKDFFSDRNAAVLVDLWSRISRIQDYSIRKKLQFCFTSILPRASKRYQWSHKAPLNAANQNYYIAPVFYEWNVYDLFNRKVKAAIKAEQYIEAEKELRPNVNQTHQEYVTCSATQLRHLEPESVQFVFTDPPFGSNIFYADMNLFQEAWLETETDHEEEAVIHTGGGNNGRQSAIERYERMLTEAFQEAYRILQPNGVISVVFGNSKGSIWSLAQRAIKNAGFHGKPLRINILDKGQRSVKGLASGKESTATLDLILSYRKMQNNEEANEERATLTDPFDLIEKVVSQFLNIEKLTVSHLYLEVLREALYQNIPVDSFDLSHVYDSIIDKGFKVESESGFIVFPH